MKTFLIAIKVLTKFCKDFYQLDSVGKQDTIDAIRKFYKLKTNRETVHVHCQIPLFIFRRTIIENCTIYLYSNQNNPHAIFSPVVFSGSLYLNKCHIIGCKNNKMLKTKKLSREEIIQFWITMKLAGLEDLLIGFEKEKGCLILSGDKVRFVKKDILKSKVPNISINRLTQICLSKKQ